MEPPAAPAPGPLWRRRNFAIAWAAGFVNNTGDWVLLVALPVYVFVETGSGSATATLFVAQLVMTAIVGPYAGALVDRWDLKRSLVLTNAAQAITVLPLLAVSADRIWPAYLVMAAQAALTQVNDPANVALLPRVVSTDELTRANSALAAAQSLARLIGSPLGGVLVAWGGLAPVVIIDALSYAIVAATLAFLTADTRPLPTPTGERRGLREGLATVRSTPLLTPLLSINAVTQVTQGAFLVLFVVFVVETLGDDGSGLGVIRGVMAIGALVGSALIARIATRAHSTTLYASGLLGMGAVALVFWNAPLVTTTLWVYVVLFSFSGLAGAALVVGLFTTLQTACPAHALGRVTGIMSAGEAIGVTTGSIVAGLLVDRVNLGTLLNFNASIYIIGGVVAFVSFRKSRGRSSEGGQTIRDSLSPQ